MARFKNIQELLLTAAARWAGKAAFRHVSAGRVREIPYGALDELSYMQARSLWRLGVRAQGRLLLFADSSPEWVITFLGALRLGATVALLHPDCPRETALAVVSQVKPQVLVAGARQHWRISADLRGTQLALIDDLLDPDGGPRLPHLMSPAPSQPALIFFPGEAPDPALGAVFSHGAVLKNIASMDTVLGFDSADVVLPVPPPSEPLSLLAGLICALSRGATVLITRTDAGSKLQKLLERENVSAVIGEPPLFRGLLAEIEAAVDELPRAHQVAVALTRKVTGTSAAAVPFVFRGLHRRFGGKIKVWLCGGGPVEDWLKQGMHSFAIPFWSVYGSTSVSPVVTVEKDPYTMVESAGLPAPRMQVRIASPDSTGSGAVCISAPGMLSEYLNNSARTAEVLSDGWFTTGDRGYVDRSGRLHVLRKRAAKHAPRPAAAPPWGAEGKKVCEILSRSMSAEVLRGVSPSGERSFAREARLSEDLGLDSFGRIEVACRLEEEFKVDIPGEAVQEAVTVEDLVTLVKHPPAAPDRLSQVMAEVVPDGAWQWKAWPREHSATIAWPFTDEPFVVAGRRALAVGMKTFSLIYNQLEVSGSDRLMIDPPYIVAANHTSDIDTVALLSCFPSGLLRMVHPVAPVEGYFADPLRAALSTYALNALPCDKFHGLQQSIAQCQELLRQGQILIIYPEGPPSADGKLGAFKQGVARLAIAAGCPVIPAHIEGARNAMPPGAVLPRAERIRVTFGLPLYPTPGNGDSAACRDFTERLRTAVHSLDPSAEPVAQRV